MAERLKVVVLDDDPTGSQTVHSCPLLLRWDLDSLRRGLAHDSPLLFVLANTRALEPTAAAERVREICRALRLALAEALAQGVLDRWLIVSRGDSTLRGHFPLELEVIGQELGPFDGTLLVPAFLPGGRTTVAGVHLLDGQPVHTTAFAQDRLFGFSTSFLPAWVEEKTQGRCPAESVERLSLLELTTALEQPPGEAPGLLQQRLAGLCGNTLMAVDATQVDQLELLGQAIRQVTAAEGGGRRLLFQSAASLLNGLVPLPAQPCDARALAALRRRDAQHAPLPGLVLVGSHVPLADAQLAQLLEAPGCEGVELRVDPDGLAEQEPRLLAALQAALSAGLTPVLFTSRGEVHCGTPLQRRALGLELAGLMARLAAALAPQLGYIVSKGGVTSHTLLADGLGLAWVELQGQLMPGLSLVLTPDGAVVPRLPVITFPGNLGDARSLRQAWHLMQSD